MNVKVRKYAPVVFHHLQRIDEISVSELITSLDPEKNMKIIRDSFAQGGRSANPILFTYDKKFLLKTISKNEKNVFIKMLPEFHRRMRDCKSYLCRIYGVFRIKVGDKMDTHVIIMRNMNELSNDTKMLTFDMKGSTKDRSVLDNKDIEMIKNDKKEDVIEKNKKKVLKDNDFKELSMSFKLNKKDAQELHQNLASDAEFLKGYNLTDYSILLTLHKYNENEEGKCYLNYRILKSSDNLYFYNFSIIDFFTVSIIY